MAELIKATHITRVRIEDEVGKVRVRAMLRTYVHPGLYILSRHKHGPSPEGAIYAVIAQYCGKGLWMVDTIDTMGGYLTQTSADSLAEAVQVALLELHK